MTTNRIAAIVGGAVLFILGLFIGAAISGGPDSAAASHTTHEADDPMGHRGPGYFRGTVFAAGSSAIGAENVMS